LLATAATLLCRRGLTALTAALRSSWRLTALTGLRGRSNLLRISSLYRQFCKLLFQIPNLNRQFVRRCGLLGLRLQQGRIGHQGHR
jgi:hypothetical protein